MDRMDNVKVTTWFQASFHLSG